MVRNSVSPCLCEKKVTLTEAQRHGGRTVDWEQVGKAAGATGNTPFSSSAAWDEQLGRKSDLWAAIMNLCRDESGRRNDQELCVSVPL